MDHRVDPPQRQQGWRPDRATLRDNQPEARPGSRAAGREQAFYPAIAGRQTSATRGSLALMPTISKYIGPHPHAYRHTSHQLAIRAAHHFKQERPHELSHVRPEEFASAMAGHELVVNVSARYRDLDRRRICKAVMPYMWQLLWGDGYHLHGADIEAVRQARERRDLLHLSIEALDRERDRCGPTRTGSQYAPTARAATTAFDSSSRQSTSARKQTPNATRQTTTATTRPTSNVTSNARSRPRCHYQTTSPQTNTTNDSQRHWDSRYLNQTNQLLGWLWNSQQRTSQNSSTSHPRPSPAGADTSRRSTARSPGSAANRPGTSTPRSITASASRPSTPPRSHRPNKNAYSSSANDAPRLDAESIHPAVEVISNHDATTEEPRMNHDQTTGRQTVDGLLDAFQTSGSSPPEPEAQTDDPRKASVTRPATSPHGD